MKQYNKCTVNNSYNKVQKIFSINFLYIFRITVYNLKTIIINYATCMKTSVPTIVVKLQDDDSYKNE